MIDISENQQKVSRAYYQGQVLDAYISKDIVVRGQIHEIDPEGKTAIMDIKKLKQYNLPIEFLGLAEWELDLTSLEKIEIVEDTPEIWRA